MENGKTDAAVRLLRDERAAATETRAALIVKRVHSLGVKNFNDGTVIRVTKTYDSATTYTYLAYKVNDKWYVTGSAKRRSDDEFEEFLAERGGFERFEINYESWTLLS